MKKKERKKPVVSFLIGSGFSYDEGIPSVGKINERLRKVDESEILIHTDQTALFLNGQKDLNRWSGRKERLFFQKFLEFYSSEILKKDQTFHYEEFYDFYSNYIHKNENEEEIIGFYKKFVNDNNNGGKTEFKDCRNCLIDFDRTFNQLLASLLHKTKYFNDADISGHYPYDSFINFLKELLKSTDIKFHTLNHDLFFDYLGNTQSGIWDKFSDGYELEGSPFYGEVYCTFNEGKENEIRKKYFVKLKRFTDKFDTPLAFFKLHGSIYTKIIYSNQPTPESIRIKNNNFIYRILKEIEDPTTKKKKLIPTWDEPSPDFLSGTTNKIRFYSDDSYYKNLFDHFQKNLKNSELLVVIGYGFQDSGINKILVNHYLGDGKKMIVIDPYKPKSSLLKLPNTKYIPLGVTQLTEEDYKSLIPEHLIFKPDKEDSTGFLPDEFF